MLESEKFLSQVVFNILENFKSLENNITNKKSRIACHYDKHF